MAKLRDTPIQAADLEEFLREHDDFALELDLFQHALELGAVAEHGGTYVDPTSGKHRQFDLRIRVEAPERMLHLAVECKNIGKNNPLLISRIPRERDEAFHEVLHSFAHRAPGEVPGSPRDRAETLRVTHHGLYPAGRPVGKSTAQVGRTLQGDLTNADSESYEKWSQALASAHDLVYRALKDADTTSATRCLSVVLPILVVSDTTLWTVDYEATGTLAGPPVQADEAELYVDRSYAVGIDTEYRISHLHVYTRTRFRAFLSELVHSDKALRRAFPHGLLPR